jgi:hypothetical protein
LGTGQDALIDEGGLHLIEAGGALDTARGGIDDFAGLLLAEGLDADIAVDEAVQGFFVAGVGELFPSLLEASLGDRANRGQFLEPFYFLTGLFNGEGFRGREPKGRGENSAEEKALTHIH